MNEGSLSPIIVKYEKLLEDDPRSRSFAPLAEAYRQVGLLDKAFDILKKGLRYNPEYLLGYLTLALCYFDKKEYGLAYSTLKPLIAQNRDNLKLQKVFAECAKKTNNLEEALDSYKYLLFLNPKDKEIADQVTLLEEELHEEAIYAKKDSPVFDVDGLKPNPADDKEIDNWVQIDLSAKEEDSSDDENEWTVGKPTEEVVARSEESKARPIFEKDDLYDEEAEIIYEKAEKVVYGDDDKNHFSTEDYLSDLDDEDYDDEQDQDQEDDNLITFKRKSAGEVEKEIAPVITHTLVDIYLKQGHYSKAREILEKILEVGPKSEEALKKLAEIDEIIKADGPDLDAQEQKEEPAENSGFSDEGRDNLMAAFDKSFGSEDSEVSHSTEESLEEFINEVDLVLADYLSEIKQRQNNFKS